MNLPNSIGIAYIDPDLVDHLFYSFVDTELHDINLIIYDRNNVVVNDNYAPKNSSIKDI